MEALSDDMPHGSEPADLCTIIGCGDVLTLVSIFESQPHKAKVKRNPNKREYVMNLLCYSHVYSIEAKYTY